MGWKSLPPQELPTSYPVNAFEKTLSNPNALIMAAFTCDPKCMGPSYGPNDELYWMRNPRFMRVMPPSSIHATRKVMKRSGSIICFATNAYRGLRSNNGDRTSIVAVIDSMYSTSCESRRLASAMSKLDASCPDLNRTSP